MRPLILPLLVAAVVGGCAMPLPQPGPPASPPPSARGCNADAAQFALGAAATPGLLQQILERTRAERLRVIRPGEAVTMDFNPRRVNVELDAGERVQRVRCG